MFALLGCVGESMLIDEIERLKVFRDAFCGRANVLPIKNEIKIE